MVYFLYILHSMTYYYQYVTLYIFKIKKFLPCQCTGACIYLFVCVVVTTIIGRLCTVVVTFISKVAIHFTLQHRSENVFQGVLHICNAFWIILCDDLFCEVLTRCAFLFLCHFVHSLSVLSFIVEHLPKHRAYCSVHGVSASCCL